jgi:pimeloyl-ACP methyl ester carboxylesterase
MDNLFDKKFLTMAKNYAPRLTNTRGYSVHINNIEMYYEEYGAGKPLLLLHGFGGCSQNWHPFTGKLSQHHRLIVVDLRGHGHSTNPGNTFTHREAATDVYLLLEKLEIDRFSAMGMSTGGMTLLHMATSQPERIDSMVLISSTTHFTDQARAIMRRASFDTMPREVQEMYRECAKQGEGQIRQLISQFNALHENYDDMNFTAQRLSTITARTLVVHGDRDHFFPVEVAVNIYRSIPNAALWIIPNGDHVPIYDFRVPFIPTALQFLDESDNKQQSTT